MCDVFELEPEPLQFIFIGFGRFFSFRQNRLKNLPVFQQCVVDVAHKCAVASPGFLLVVIIVAAIVITEFFVDSSF